MEVCLRPRPGLTRQESSAYCCVRDPLPQTVGRHDQHVLVGWFARGQVKHAHLRTAAKGAEIRAGPRCIEPKSQGFGTNNNNENSSSDYVRI